MNLKALWMQNTSVTGVLGKRAEITYIKEDNT